MFPTLLASFWSNLSVFHEKIRITKKCKKIFFFRKKMYLFFFWIFCFLTFSRIFQEVKKSENFCVFFLQVKFTWCLWTKIVTWNLGHLSWKFFWSFLQTNVIAAKKIFFMFLRFMSMFWTNLKKKKLKIWKKFQKCSTFEILFVALRPKFRPIGRKFHQKYSFAQNYYQKHFK